MTTQNKTLARGERNLPARAGQPLRNDVENAYFAFGPRTYSPAMGRFLSPDPLWESFRNANPYHYCFNNPISHKDPSGLAPEKEKSKEDELQRTEDEYEKRLREYMFLQECYRIEAAMLKALTPDWLTNGSYGTFEPFNSGISYIAVGGGPGGGGDCNSGVTGSSYSVSGLSVVVYNHSNGTVSFSSLTDALSNVMSSLKRYDISMYSKLLYIFESVRFNSMEYHQGGYLSQLCEHNAFLFMQYYYNTHNSKGYKLYVK